MAIAVIILIVILGAYAFYAARAANVCSPQYIVNRDSSPMTKISALALDDALSLCNARQRRAVLELAEKVETNYRYYCIYQNDKKRDRYLSSSFFIPLIPALVSYLKEKDVLFPLCFLLLYAAAFYIQRKFHIGTHPYEEVAIPSVAYSTAFDSADELIDSWDNAFSRAGYPFVQNTDQYDKMYKEARATFPVMVCVSVFISLSILFV